MPQNTTIPAVAGAWTEITNADTTTALTFQNTGTTFVRMKGRAGTGAPTTIGGSIRYNPGQGERSVTLAEMFPGIAGVNRLWAWADAPGEVMISHA